MKDIRLVEILHNLTQQGWTITFRDDFSGMLQIYVSQCGEDEATHYHVGVPDSSMKDLEKAVRNKLAALEEQ